MARQSPENRDLQRQRTVTERLLVDDDDRDPRRVTGVDGRQSEADGCLDDPVDRTQEVALKLAAFFVETGDRQRFFV